MSSRGHLRYRFLVSSRNPYHVAHATTPKHILHRHGWICIIHCNGWKYDPSCDISSHGMDWWDMYKHSRNKLENYVILSTIISQLFAKLLLGWLFVPLHPKLRRTICANGIKQGVCTFIPSLFMHSISPLEKKKIVVIFTSQSHTQKKITVEIQVELDFGLENWTNWNSNYIITH